ncbi:MAG: ABC transporter ATP-binding protein [Desulfuromonadaceae bacterium]|nr:ABC transporter ATP-binding protein [Desulfuromonadaceae bacterium]MDD2849451.1 ABC transporter ATP-binding protein [Desulfuromonadaceae bacterium]MDD4130535.1 ABC transporter ATP-binding protein [Desulfuromonadaceae bacterium]
MPILEARSISKSYSINNSRVTVLDGVSLCVDEGEFLVIKGESGSGKSTLLSILSGLDRPETGRILLVERDITELSEEDLAPVRNTTFGFVFQSFHLIPSLSAIENVMFPAELRGDPHARAKANMLLEQVGLSARSASFPHQLSGGEKQRCAICRALVNEPQILFADEPTGNLDLANGRTVMDLLRELHRERRTTLVLVTHSLEIAQTADRVVTLRDGRIVANYDHV